MVKILVPVTALSNNSSILCSAPVDDKSGAVGLLPREIPGILTIRALVGPSPAVPSTFYAASLS